MDAYPSWWQNPAGHGSLYPNLMKYVAGWLVHLHRIGSLILLVRMWQSGSTPLVAWPHRSDKPNIPVSGRCPVLLDPVIGAPPARGCASGCHILGRSPGLFSRLLALRREDLGLALTPIALAIAPYASSFPVRSPPSSLADVAVSIPAIR